MQGDGCLTKALIGFLATLPSLITVSYSFLPVQLLVNWPINDVLFS